jgi:hypothetical protein
MEVETKFLRLFKPAALGDRIDGWRVWRIKGDKMPSPFRSDGGEATAGLRIDASQVDVVIPLPPVAYGCPQYG